MKRKKERRKRTSSKMVVLILRQYPMLLLLLLLAAALLVLLLKVRLAQKSIPTGLVYRQNEEVLDEVGAADLQKMLERRDWSGLEGKKVSRFL